MRKIEWEGLDLTGSLLKLRKKILNFRSPLSHFKIIIVIRKRIKSNYKTFP